MENILDLAIDEFDDHLNKGLTLAGNARRCASRHNAEPKTKNSTDPKRNQPAIPMEAVAEHRPSVVGQVMLDVFSQTAGAFFNAHFDTCSFEFCINKDATMVITSPISMGSGGKCHRASDR